MLVLELKTSVPDGVTTALGENFRVRCTITQNPQLTDPQWRGPDNQLIPENGMLYIASYFLTRIKNYCQDNEIKMGLCILQWDAQVNICFWIRIQVSWQG